MRRLISLIAIGSALVLATNVVVLARGQNEIRTTGDEKVVPNAMVQATIRFTPGMIKVANGEVVTFTYDDSSGAPSFVWRRADVFLNFSANGCSRPAR